MLSKTTTQCNVESPMHRCRVSSSIVSIKVILAASPSSPEVGSSVVSDWPRRIYCRYKWMNIIFLYERSFKTLLLNVSKFWTHDFQGRSSLNVDLWNDWQPPVFLDKNLLVRKCISNIINSYNNGKIEPLWEVGNGNVDGDGRWGSQVRQSDISAR